VIAVKLPDMSWIRGYRSQNISSCGLGARAQKITAVRQQGFGAVPCTSSHSLRGDNANGHMQTRAGPHPVASLRDFRNGYVVQVTKHLILWFGSAGAENYGCTTARIWCCALHIIPLAERGQCKWTHANGRSATPSCRQSLCAVAWASCVSSRPSPVSQEEQQRTSLVELAAAGMPRVELARADEQRPLRALVLHEPVLYGQPWMVSQKELTPQVQTEPTRAHAVTSRPVGPAGAQERH
jgi:hypothetical protein